MKGYLTKTTDIAHYLYKTIKGLGFYVRSNNSDISESIYLNVNTGTREAPESIHLRISNHQASRNNTSVRYDYDICASQELRKVVDF